MKPLRISEAASLELAEAVRWYEERRPGWGTRLFDAATNAVQLIEAHPEIGSSRPGRQPSRQFAVRGFPYLVVYRDRGEDVYVVVKTPEKGTAVTDYISAKSFLLVKRKYEGSGQETFFGDYRNVDGEMVPFLLVIQGNDGRVVGKVQEVKFNTSIPPSTFRPAVKPR